MKEKTFDKVDQEKILTKLHFLGIGTSLHLWIRSFLSNGTQTVLVDGSVSKPALVLSGVPQGRVIGPLLFLAYINDINEHPSPVTHIRLFADDNLLYRNILTPYYRETSMYSRPGNLKTKWNYTLINARYCKLPIKKSPSRKPITSIAPDRP